LFDADRCQLKSWNNKLIWGYRNFILSTPKNGPILEEIGVSGGIKVIYIDQPFDVEDDFTMDVEIRGEALSKDAARLEELAYLAYRDTWGRG
jgi:hypothetical protein